MGGDDDHKEAKRRKQLKKMTRMVANAWGLPHSEPFQESHHSTPEVPADLSTVGQNLDNGSYAHGRSGWEKFATDMGGVYRRHMLKKTKFAKVAKEHLEQVLVLLAKIDPHLADIASKCVPATHKDEASRKRKPSKNMNGDSSGKKSKHEVSREENKKSKKKAPKSLADRERTAMEELASYVEERGGDRAQVDSFRSKAHERHGRMEVTFHSTAGRMFRTKSDVAKFLGLTDSIKTSSKVASIPNKKKRPRNHRENETEKRKLRKELEKLVKSHQKASKALDDFVAENNENQHPIDDKLLMKKDDSINSAQLGRYVQSLPYMDGLPGFPAYCTPDICMIWDFLCTFHRPLSLVPIPLNDFIAALNYESLSPTNHSQGESNNVPTHAIPPVYLAEAHLALLKLLLSDQTSEEWWWSILEMDTTSETTAAEDTSVPTIKVDFRALLDVQEEKEVTMSWIKSLEDVRQIKTNSGGEIRTCLHEAMSKTKNEIVKRYLAKAEKKWKANSAGFTKRAVTWLVDKMYEARPDLLGEELSPDVLAQQKAKVAQDTAQAMAQLTDPHIPNVDDDDDSDDEGSDLEEEEDTDLPNGHNSAQGTSGEGTDEDSLPVSSPIPPRPLPTFVDMLLPPAKPIPSSDVVSPLSWPCITGTIACRILHFYKKKRNELDDKIREARGLPPMTRRERRAREAIASSRILSECGTDDGGSNPLDEAVSHLCSGRPYLELTPVQKVCILRLLVEGAYDTIRVRDCVESNFKARASAVKALDTEEKRAKREAREEEAETARAAKERLVSNTRSKFLEKKRTEIWKQNEKSNEFSVDILNNLTDEDIISFDEETQAEYDSLPGPQSFRKAEVQAMVSMIQEEAAFNSSSVEVLSMESIEKRDADHMRSLEERLLAYDNSSAMDSIFSERAIEKLRRERDILIESQIHLKTRREDAIGILKEALEDGTIKSLRSAFRLAKQAKLMGQNEDKGGVWALDLLRDVALGLKTAERRKRVIEAQKDLISKRNKCFIRTEAIGRDRFGNRFWKFDPDDENRIWMEANFVVENETKSEETNAPTDMVNLVMPKSDVAIGAQDQIEDFKDSGQDDQAVSEFLTFCRRENHTSGELSALARKLWGCHLKDSTLRSLVKNLDERGVREAQLKTALQEIIEAAGAATLQDNQADHNSSEHASGGHEDESPMEGAHNDILTAGDEDAFQHEKDSFDTTASSVEMGVIDGMTTAIGEKVRIRNPFVDEMDTGEDQFFVGEVTGWTNNQDQPIRWHVKLKGGEERSFSGSELIEALALAKLCDAPDDEANSRIFAYRNSLGRHCGRAADALDSSTPLVLAKYMIKKEQDFYFGLKNRSVESNWGGKSGARNAWIASMKELGHQLVTVRDGMLMLEDALVELCGGMPNDDAVQDNPQPDRSGKDLLSDYAFRADIELESSLNGAAGLWNSKESRAVFYELVQTSTNTALLALCFELLCRNVDNYIRKTQPAVRAARQPRAAAEVQPFRMTRRMNAWQMAQMEQMEQMEQHEIRTRTTRRMNAWQLAQQSADY